MTAPLTPPPPPHESSHGSPHDESSPGDPVWHAPADTPLWDAGTGKPVGPAPRTEIREAGVILVALAVLGVGLGALWVWLAPRVALVGDVVDGTWAVYVRDTEGEQAIGADGTFTLLALAFGAVTALAVFVWRRRGGVPLVLALGVGGLLASFIAWRVGVWLGPTDDVLAHAKEAGQGVTFSAPLELGAKGALLAWSVAALLVHLALTALFAPRDETPEPLGEEQPQGLTDGGEGQAAH
ncbi:AAA family ATPase [Streptomyces sp. NPDC059477]|uniref:AAA family ATPase n=1 Tax=Streptomyces sp. NPDC059477 TaxID=3346847 RepID=UPI003680B4D6